MKVAFIMPTYFDPSSVIAGGERYAYELAKAVSEKADTTIFTFSENPEKNIKDGKLNVRYCKTLFHAGGIANPFSVTHLMGLHNFDVVHCLQFKTLVTETAILLGALQKKKVFVTDLAGGTYYCLSHFFPTEKCVTEFLFISDYNRSLHGHLHQPSRIIYGGVDQDFFKPGAAPKSGRKILYVGRIFKLKGLHVLIEALPENGELEIVGQCHDSDYLANLKKMADGKKIRFYDSLPDSVVLEKYQQAAMTVLPSLVDGGFTSAMESMSCETPVIGTRFGSLPEVVEDGVTGWIVPPDDVPALRAKIEFLLSDPEKAAAMGKRGRQAVLQHFTWGGVAQRCLEAYK